MSDFVNGQLERKRFQIIILLVNAYLASNAIDIRVVFFKRERSKNQCGSEIWFFKTAKFLT
jgi:hypothetical protein